MSTTMNFKQIKHDYDEGKLGRLDALYKIIKNATELGDQSTICDLGDELIQELRSYINSYDPERRSFPSNPPSQDQVNVVEKWLIE